MQITICEGKQRLAPFQQQNETGSQPSNDDAQDPDEKGEGNEDVPPSVGPLFPLDYSFNDKLYKTSASLKEMKSICNTHGFNPDTAKNTPVHTASELTDLAIKFMSIRSKQISLQQLNEHEFEEMLRFGNLSPALITDKDRRGDAVNIFKRWWLQSLVDIGRMTPAEVRFPWHSGL